MKILAFSDVHNSQKALNTLEKKAKKADILVCAGDFTIFEEGIDRVLKRLNSFGKKVILVHGNHENPLRVKKMAAKYNHIEYVHKRIHKVVGYTFVGHGGEGFAQVSKDFENYANKLKITQKDNIIFVTHQPPHNTKLDYIWAHHGNKSYRNFIKKEKPILAICGHLHETAGLKDNIGKCTLVNPGPKGMLITV